MSTLANCIKKAGKALSGQDRTAINELYENLLQSGVSETEAARRAVQTRLYVLDNERADLVSRIEDAGGFVPQPISLAKGSAHLEVAKKITSMDLLDGTEVLDIPDAKVTAAGKMKATGAQIADALVKRTLKANRGKPLTARTERTREILSEALAQETAAAIQRSGHAGDWYSTVLHNAVNIISEIHPELKTDPNARAAFMVGLAITSNGLDVGTNSRAAEEVYVGFKKKGKFPTKGYGDKGPAMTQAFEQANDLIDELGLANFVRFMNTEFTVGELRTMGFNVSGESVDHKTHGSVIFGPKIGGGFYQNLMGNYEPLTMDRWWMRTWGRLTGELLPRVDQLPEAQVTRLTDAMRASPEVVAEMGFDLEATLNDDAKVVEFAKAVHKRYARSGFKEKTELNKAGKNLDIALHAPIIAPGGAEARNWMREIAGLALEKLRQRNININAASMQALVWYPEKDLYLKYGATSAKGEPTDYEQEFAKLAAERGISQSRIDAARTGDSAERPSGSMGSDGEVSDQLEGGPTRFEGSERRRLIQRAVTLGARQQFPRPYRGAVPKGDRRSVAKQEFKPEPKVKNAFARAGLSAPTVFELSQGNASTFFNKISDAKKGKDAAAVYIYDQEEYEDMRLFLTEDGMAGFALKGDDIVSVFKHPDSQDKGVAQALIGLAVQEGGRKLDAFDTVLPAFYSLQGFKVVSRTPWSDSEAPSDWSKNHFKDFNEGEPDVVFMVYDRNYTGTYQGSVEGQLTEDYDVAVQLQSEAVEDLRVRNAPPSVMLSLPDPIQDRINRDPDGPLSQYHKLGATMEDQRLNGPSKLPFPQVRQVLSDYGVAATLASVPRRNLADFLPESAAPSVQRYIREANRMSGRRNELLSQYEEVARDWAKWARENKREAGRLADLMHAATLAGVDPSIPYKPLKSGKLTEEERRAEALRKEQHIILQDAWNRVGEKGQEIYRNVRDTYIKMRKDLEAGLLARIEQSDADGATKKALMDKMRTEFEQGRVTGPYFPLMRYGDLWAVAKDAEGEVISFSRFENRDEQKAWVKEFKAAGYETAQGRRSKSDGELVGKISPEFATKVAELAKKTGDDALVDDIWQLYLRNLPEMSMRKRFLHRKGRLGFAADALRAYANVTFRGAHQQAKLEHVHNMQRHLASLRDEVRAIENNPELSKEFAWATPVYDEMMHRHEKAMKPDASPVSVMMTSAGFLWWLGFTPAAAAVNLTQTFLVGLPVLSARFNVLGASRELSKASSLWFGSWGPIENRLRGDERDAIVEARRIGLFEKTQAHDLAGVTETGEAGYGGAWQYVVEKGSWMFHKMEQANREITFLAAYRLAKAKGISHADSIIMAEDLTWDSHFDYNNENRPRWMQGNMLRVLTLFKQYSLNMTYRMARDFKDMVTRDLPKEQRKEAMQRFGGMMMMAWVFSGLQGLPAIFSQGVPWVLEAVFGDEDEPWDATDALRVYLAEMFGAKGAEAIMKGPVDALAGPTVSSRVALSSLWWRDPSVYDDDEAAFTHIVMEMLGPIPTTIKDVTIGTARAWSEGHPDRAFESVTPKFFKDILRARRFAVDGALTWHSPPSVLLKPEEFTTLDLFWQAFGFTPARLTMQYEQNRAIKFVELGLRERRQRVIDKYMVALFNKDKKALSEANEAIGKWNRSNPSLAIMGDSLTQGALTRYDRMATSRGGVTLPDNLYYLYGELMFTPEERLETEE